MISQLFNVAIKRGQFMKTHRIIGKRLPRIDAMDKVTGKALYTDDMSLPGMLCGLILRSPLPHAKSVISRHVKRPKAASARRREPFTLAIQILVGRGTGTRSNGRGREQQTGWD